VELDALRGFALLGIALANFPEFSLYTFLSGSEQAAMPTAHADKVIRFIQLMLVDGKFYSIFSVLFGIGFSIILANAVKKGADGIRIFYRRMIGLLIIGLIHLKFIWNGDILMLYALMGMMLPLFRNCTVKGLLSWAAVMLLIPLPITVLREVTGIDLSDALYDAWWNKADAMGVTEENFAIWLRDADAYPTMFRFLRQGAVERMWEFVAGLRYFKVLGLFLIGYAIGKEKLFGKLTELRGKIRSVALKALCIGIPLSALYAYCAMTGGNTVLKEILYCTSVYPTAFGYICLLMLLMAGKGDDTLNGKAARTLACPGRMALTSYLMQSVIGIVLFYGVGFGLGTTIGLWQTELVAAAAFMFETAACALWLRFFSFGPVEWIWRMFTYGRYFPLRKIQ